MPCGASRAAAKIKYDDHAVVIIHVPIPYDNKFIELSLDKQTPASVKYTTEIGGRAFLRHKNADGAAAPLGGLLFRREVFLLQFRVLFFIEMRCLYKC